MLSEEKLFESVLARVFPSIIPEAPYKETEVQSFKLELYSVSEKNFKPEYEHVMHVKEMRF